MKNVDKIIEIAKRMRSYIYDLSNGLDNYQNALIDINEVKEKSIEFIYNSVEEMIDIAKITHDADDYDIHLLEIEQIMIKSINKTYSLIKLLVDMSINGIDEVIKILGSGSNTVLIDDIEF